MPPKTSGAQVAPADDEPDEDSARSDTGTPWGRRGAPGGATSSERSGRDALDGQRRTRSGDRLLDGRDPGGRGATGGRLEQGGRRRTLLGARFGGVDRHVV